jgi:hypothetical protein
MNKQKIFIVQTQKKYTTQIKELIKFNKIDFWFFLGNDATIPFLLEKSILNNIQRLNISKHLSQSQYHNRVKYIDFIDNLEKNTGRNTWWDSMISGKNPWISNFYLKFSQLDVFNKLINNQKKKGKNVLVLVEKEDLFKTIKNNFEKKSNYFFYSNKNPKQYIKTIIRGVASAPFQMFLKRKYQRIFKENTANLKNIKEKKILIIPTFIDQRSFRTGNYRDPFMGRIIQNTVIKDKKVIILPIVVSASNKQLQLFNIWLGRKKHKVYFVSQSLSTVKILYHSIKKILSKPVLVDKLKFLEYDVTNLINNERKLEWSKFNLQYYLIKEFSKQICNDKREIEIIYPFENQNWERTLLYNMRKYNKVFAVGIQNAPCPKLSLRYYVSEKHLEDIPLPDVMITTGNISYKALFKNYNSVCKVIQSSSARTFVFDNNKQTNEQTKQILVGCSIGVNESIELITFVVSALKNTDLNIFVNIVPHPFVTFNYSKLLFILKAPKYIKISALGFKEELARSNFILFDSSTVGLEGIMNGVTPVFIGHECAVHVNPNEFDTEVTKYAYSYRDLVNIIKSENFIENGAKNIGEKYFGNQQSDKLLNILENVLS